MAEYKEGLNGLEIHCITLKKWLLQQYQSIYKNKYIQNIERFFEVPVFFMVKTFVTGSIFLILIAVLFYDNIFVTFLLSPYLYFWFKEEASQIKRKQKEKLKIQFKDGMQSVSFALNTGSSIENAFRSAVEELKVLHGSNSVIVKEFQKIVVRLSCNENIEDIFEEFAVRSKVDDIGYFSAVFRYAKRCGGDLIAIIKHTAKRLQEKNETVEQIQTIISGKRMEQRVMSAIPLVVIGYLKLSSYEFIAPLYHNLIGIFVMTVCFLMYLLSNYIAKRIINIEV